LSATAQLTLLQVDLVPPKKNELKNLTGQNVPGSVQLEELDNISDHWPVTSPLNPNHLHIIVEPPSGASCFPSYVNPRSFLRRREVHDEDDQPSLKRPRLDCSWLNELHSKIWNRGELESTLFRKVEVTQAHYDALQDRLNRQYPDRGTKGYNGSPNDVLSDKLGILKWTAPAEADNHEDRVDDDDGLEASGSDDDQASSGDDGLEGSNEDDLSFPSTFRYLDLSSLNLNSELERFPLALFLRQEYDHISRLISNDPQYKNDSVMVNGQPGTGEVLVSLFRRI